MHLVIRKSRIFHLEAPILEADFKSEPARAWKTCKERSAKLNEAQQTAAARKVLESSPAYFQNDEDVSPHAVKFYAESQGWDEAKWAAATCSKNFRRVSAQCMQAAASPAKLAEAERKSKLNADQIVSKWIKKR